MVTSIDPPALICDSTSSRISFSFGLTYDIVTKNFKKPDKTLRAYLLKILSQVT